jgi:hypothetical protein
MSMCAGGLQEHDWVQCVGMVSAVRRLWYWKWHVPLPGMPAQVPSKHEHQRSAAAIAGRMGEGSPNGIRFRQG